jgi:hypothetical protein
MARHRAVSSPRRSAPSARAGGPPGLPDAALSAASALPSCSSLRGRFPLRHRKTCAETLQHPATARRREAAAGCPGLATDGPCNRRRERCGERAGGGRGEGARGVFGGAGGRRVRVRVEGGCGAACGVGVEGRMAWIRAVRCIDRDDTTTGSGPVANDADLTCSATARLVSALPALDALIPPSALRPIKPAT